MFNQKNIFFALFCILLSGVPLAVAKMVDAPPWLELWMILIWNFEALPHVVEAVLKLFFGEEDE